MAKKGTFSKLKKKEQKIIEIVKSKPRQEEEKFFEKFSTTQINAILVFILAGTFLVQGVMRYLDYIGKVAFIKPWLFLVILSLFFLVTSVLTISLDNVLAPLKMKRKIKLIGFVTFLLGVGLFLTCLFGLIVIL